MSSEFKFQLMIEENNLYGLAYNCPCLKRLDDCPFKDFEHLSFKEKVSWIESKCKEEKYTIWEHHEACSKDR